MERGPAGPLNSWARIVHTYPGLCHQKRPQVLTYQLLLWIPQNLKTDQTFLDLQRHRC